MSTHVKKYILKGMNSLLSAAGFELVRTNPGYKDYLKFRDTLSAAERAGLSVGDYIEAKSRVTGECKKTLKKMSELGVFDKNIERVCEIGPGSGRYIGETLRYCKPRYYEIYETAEHWSKWLATQYEVVARPADGVSLAMTPSSSIDLVQAHKVYPGLPFFTTVRYFAEMARIVKDGGTIVFDIFTEDCMDDKIISKWLDKEVNIDRWNFTPTLMPKRLAIDFFTNKGFLLNGTFFIALWPGITECMVFSK